MNCLIVLYKHHNDRLLRNLYDEISQAIQAYGVISYGKCGISLLMIKLHEEKSHRVSPNVAFNFFEPITRVSRALVIKCCCDSDVLAIENDYILVYKPSIL